MLAIFWTAYVPFVIVLLSLIGSFIMHSLRRLFAARQNAAVICRS